jgi:hypothetical protein
MGFVEGFAEYTLSNSNSNESVDIITEDDYQAFQMKFLLLVMIIKVVLVYIVSKFLWPRVIPKVFTGVKANPGFINILGLVVIYYFLF